jgi:hypothetical protein
VKPASWLTRLCVGAPTQEAARTLVPRPGTVIWISLMRWLSLAVPATVTVPLTDGRPAFSGLVASTCPWEATVVGTSSMLISGAWLSLWAMATRILRSTWMPTESVTRITKV